MKRLPKKNSPNTDNSRDRRGLAHIREQLEPLLRLRLVLIVISLAASCFVVLLVLYYISMVYKVEVVDPMGKPVALRGVEDILGHNMYALSNEKLTNMVKSSNPRIKEVTIEKVLPQTIRLRVVLADAVAFHEVAENTYLMVSKDGVLIELQYEQPTLQGEIVYYQKIVHGEYELGKPMPFLDFRFATALAYEVAHVTSEPFKIVVSDADQIDIRLADTIIRTSFDDNPQKQLSTLVDVLNMIRLGAQRIKFVDLRFEKLIIEKW